MSDKSDFSKLYDSSRKESSSSDPCMGKKNADCTGPCHLEVSEYSPAQLKRLSSEQKMENLQLYGSKNIKKVACKSRHGRNLAARSSGKKVSVRSKKSKPAYSGSEYCPQFAGKYQGGGKDECNAAVRPDGRSCNWVKKGRKCRVKPQKKVYDSKYKDAECNPLYKKRDCTGKFGKNLGCRWYKSRKSPKSKKNEELYGRMGCWSADPTRYGGESSSSSLRAAEKLLQSNFVVPEGSCQGLAVMAKNKNDAYHKCYSRSNCKIVKKSKRGGDKLNNLRCVEIPGSYAKHRSGVFSKLSGMNMKGLADRISSSAPSSDASSASSLTDDMDDSSASGLGDGKKQDVFGGMFGFNSKRGRKRSRRSSRKSRKSRGRKRSRRSSRKSRKSRKSRGRKRSRRRSRKSRKSRKSRGRKSRKSRGRKSRKSRGRKSRRRSRRSSRKSRGRSGSKKSRCASLGKKSCCGKSKKSKGCVWRKRVGCVKKPRKSRGQAFWQVAWSQIA